MPVTDPRVQLGDADADALTADIRTTDPASDTAGVVVRIAGTLPAPALSSGAATSAAQTNGTQVSNPSPSTPSSSSAYESGRVLKASAGTFRSVSVQMSPALASGTYYAQLLTASATVPVDGAVTFLRAPRAIVHTIGAAETENFYEGDSGITFTVGCTVCVSSTQFTKTAVASAALFDGSVL